MLLRIISLMHAGAAGLALFVFLETGRNGNAGIALFMGLCSVLFAMWSEPTALNPVDEVK